MIHRGRGKKSYKVIDYFVKWKGWTHEHNSWVRNLEMGNAQEAIEEYEQRTRNARRVDITKIVTPKTRSIITMILNHEYSDDGEVKYLCQSNDGQQKWKKDLKEYNFYWVKLTKDYWTNQADSQLKTPNDEL